ncbi:cytochrome c maturation protein CcmE [Yunchengibacter salinarum]|uniref:cytochrome c maturation protein CcmE n=1 Tax=Yunchengibacter salinarum TaxID=3133399 RepID=UPI0035B5C53F
MAGLVTRKKQRLLVISAALATLAGAVALILVALGGDSLSLFLQPTALKARAESGQLAADQRVRLGGLVAEDSFSRLDDKLTYRFVVTDCVADIPVHYKGLLPDLFREGQGVVTEGRLTADGTFRADTVLAKHDENYAPPGSMPENPEACAHPDNMSSGPKADGKDGEKPGGT